MVAAAGLLWSTLGIGVRFMDEVGVWAILFYRGIAQVLVLVALIAVRHRRRFIRSVVGIGLKGLISGASLMFASVTFVYALKLTTVARATLILSAAPVLAGLLGWLLLREPITRRNWWTMGMAAVGLAVITQAGTESGDLAGTLLALGSALAVAR